MMNDTVRQQNDYTGVTAWHDAGYKGNGVVVWDMEGLSDHGNGTRQRILDAAPEADVINATNTIVTKGGVIISETVDYGVLKMSADQFINAYHVSILSASKGGNGDTCEGKRLLYHGLKQKYNLCLFNSAGNDGDSGVKGGTLPESEAIYVGAAMLYKDTELRMWNYSSIGDEKDEVDFSTFTGNKSGTSFSCPYLAGMAALLQQRYGFDTTQDEIYAYFKMIARPIDAGHPSKVEGYDYWSGYGIPILPDPKKRLVRMTIGSKTYKVDGETKTMDTAPFIYQQRTFVPIAFIALALGASVRWNPQEQEVIISRGGRILSMRIGRREYMLNGKPYQMDTAPFIRDQRTQVPISFVSLALGCKVAWVEKEKKVLILE